MSEKVIGYILLTSGVFVILFSLVNVYFLLLGQISAVTLFNFEAVSVDTAQLLGGDLTPQERAALQQQLGNSSIELIPSQILNETSNLIAHIVIMGLMASIGYRLGMLGVFMLRTINIPIKKS